MDTTTQQKIQPAQLRCAAFSYSEFRPDESTSRERIRVDSIESSEVDNIFNLPSKPSCAILSMSHANRLPAWPVDIKGDDILVPRVHVLLACGGDRGLWGREWGDDSCRFNQRGFTNRLPVSQIVNTESTLIGYIGQPSHFPWLDYKSMRPHFLWVYRGSKPLGMSGEHEKSFLYIYIDLAKPKSGAAGRAF